MFTQDFAGAAALSKTATGWRIKEQLRTMSCIIFLNAAAPLFLADNCRLFAAECPINTFSVCACHIGPDFIVIFPAACLSQAGIFPGRAFAYGFYACIGAILFCAAVYLETVRTAFCGAAVTLAIGLNLPYVRFPFLPAWNARRRKEYTAPGSICLEYFILSAFKIVFIRLFFPVSGSYW